MFSEKAGKLFKILMIVSTIVIVVMAILGGICFSRNGWYPKWEETFTVLFGNIEKNCYKIDDSFGFMLYDGIAIVPDFVMLVSALVLGGIYNFQFNPFKSVLSLIAFAGLTGFLTYGYFNQAFAGSTYETTNTLAITMLVSIPVFILCFAKTPGAVMVLISIAGILIKNIFVPAIMWFAFLSTAAKIVVLILAIAYVVIMSMDVGKLVAGSVGVKRSSARTESASKNNKKAKERYNMLQNRVNACKKGLKGHREGSWNYAHVDEKVTRRMMENDLKEMESLEKSI